MKLKVWKRAAEKKGELNKMRREGNIPAVIYKRGETAENIAINSAEFSAFLRKVTPGRLSTTSLTLVDEKGKERHMLVKDIQYNITTYDVIHLDFEELHANMPINIKVPIECTGVAECIGVKLGGFLRQVIRYVKVRCLPKDIPSAFVVDVKDLGQAQSRRLKDIGIPQTIRPLADLNEVAVVVAKR